MKICVNNYKHLKESQKDGFVEKRSRKAASGRMKERLFCVRKKLNLREIKERGKNNSEQ